MVCSPFKEFLAALTVLPVPPAALATDDIALLIAPPIPLLLSGDAGLR